MQLQVHIFGKMLPVLITPIRKVPCLDQESFIVDNLIDMPLSGERSKENHHRGIDAQ